MDDLAKAYLASAGSGSAGAPGAEWAPANTLLAGGQPLPQELPLPAGPQRTLRPYLLRRQWALLLAVFVVSGGVGLGIIQMTVVPRYRASATVEVSPVIPQLLAGKSDMVPLYESYRQSQVDHILGSEVLDKVLDREDVRRTRWYQQLPVTVIDRVARWSGLAVLQPARDRLAAELEVVAPKGKQLIQVSLRTPFQGEGRTLIDAVVQEYVKFTRERASGDQGEVRQQLQEEIRKTRDALLDLERRSADLREQLGTGAPEQLVQQRLLRLDELTAQHKRLKMETAVRRRLLGETGAAAAGPGPASQSSALRYARDTAWRKLRESLDSAEQDLAQAAARFGRANPALQRLEAARDVAAKRLQERQVELDALGPVTGDELAGMGEELRRMEIEAEELDRLIAAAREDARRVAESAEKLTKLAAENERTQELYQTLSRRLYEMEMNGQAAGQIAWSSAYEPALPDDDRRLKFSAAVLAGSLALALGVGILRLKFSPAVQELEEVLPPIGATLLGRMPLQRLNRTALLEESPVQMESVRVVRTALLHQLQRQGSMVVQITSAAVGAGKSTLATLLARSLAQLGKRVLLVDADLRRPTLAGRFSLSEGPGLINVLAGTETDQAAIQATATANLAVLPAGVPTQPSEYELIANGVFSAQLARWRERYDIVLLDGAPLLGTADGAILSRHADGTIVVVREGHCRRDDLADALAVLHNAGGRLIGSVFVGSTSGRAYDYGYGYGYGYARLRAARVLDVHDRVEERGPGPSTGATAT